MNRPSVVAVRLTSVVAAAALAAGCGAPTDEAAGVDDLPSPSDSTTASAPEASGETSQPSRRDESPKAFVRRWIRVSNKMQNTGEIGPYLRIPRGCSDCRAIAKRVESMFDSGGFARTRGLKVLHMSSSDASGNGPVIDVRVDSGPTEFQERKGGPVERLPGGIVVYRFRLSASQPWQMTMLTQVPS